MNINKNYFCVFFPHETADEICLETKIKNLITNLIISNNEFFLSFNLGFNRVITSNINTITQIPPARNTHIRSCS